LHLARLAGQAALSGDACAVGLAACLRNADNAGQDAALSCISAITIEEGCASRNRFPDKREMLF
jgi:hypothetical protein